MNELLRIIEHIKVALSTPDAFIEKFGTLNIESDNLNTQLTIFIENEKQNAIDHIIHEINSRINWDVWRSKISNDLTKLRVPTKQNWNYSINEITDIEIDLFDEDVFMAVYDVYSDETSTAKQYNNAIQAAREEISRIEHEVRHLSEYLNSITSKLIDEFLNNGMNVLYNMHYTYVFMIKNKYKDIHDHETISGITIPLKKGQQEFITNAINLLNPR